MKKKSNKGMKKGEWKKFNGKLTRISDIPKPTEPMIPFEDMSKFAVAQDPYYERRDNISDAIITLLHGLTYAEGMDVLENTSNVLKNRSMVIKKII